MNLQLNLENVNNLFSYNGNEFKLSVFDPHKRFTLRFYCKVYGNLKFIEKWKFCVKQTLYLYWNMLISFIDEYEIKISKKLQNITTRPCFLNGKWLFNCLHWIFGLH